VCGLLRAVVAACVVSASAAAPAQPGGSSLVTHGGCRDGVANGGFEVRSPAGRLRVAGAFHEGRRTGTFIFWTAGGERIAVVPFDNDVRNGTIALWHDVAGHARRLEAPYVRGVAHGMHRGWQRNGSRLFEVEYDHDRVASVIAWSASGKPLAEAEARRIVAEARRRDEAVLAGLETMIAQHRPVCDAVPRTTAALDHHPR